ncbi:MAG: hypothetical protein PHH28_00560 [Desulfuromonadaceae bacterium]|nr:hypothetical protein [Desulfuromonadaceae bacterium]
MKALENINTYYHTRMENKSIYFDGKIQEIRLALLNARDCKQAGDTEWFAINSMIALKLTEDLMAFCLKESAPRQFLKALYMQIMEEN